MGLRFSFPLLCVGLVLGLSTHASELDSCRPILDDSLQKEFNLKQWTYNGLSSVSSEQVTAKLGLYSGPKVALKGNDRDQVLSYVTQAGYEYYLLTGTTNYSASFMDVLVVRSQDCKTIDRKTVYFD